MALSFRLGSIPVRVHGSFFLVVIMLGMTTNLAQLAEWVIIVFVGVLLHELGHALVGKSFGLVPRIDLAGITGLTSWTGGDVRGLGTAKRVGISLAGPFTGILVGTLTVLLRLRAGLPWFAFGVEDGTPFDQVTNDVVWVNAGWGLLNLLPILPLDGGNVLFLLVNRMTGGKGEKPARIVSMVFAGAAVALALYKRNPFTGFLAAIFFIQNLQSFRAVSALNQDAPLRERLKAGFGALDHGETNEAIRAGEEVVAHAAHPAIRADGVRLLAFGYLYAGHWPNLMGLLESPACQAIGDAELAKFEEALRELDRPTEAARLGEIRAARRTPKF
jgi:Zn-dependent protease